jgi:hypothetical protein
VKTHVTAANDNTSDLGNTITTYKCIAWCATVKAIPTMLRINVLPSHLTDSGKISTDSKCKCPLLNVSICTNAILDGTLPILNLCGKHMYVA